MKTKLLYFLLTIVLAFSAFYPAKVNAEPVRGTPFVSIFTNDHIQIVWADPPPLALSYDCYLEIKDEVTQDIDRYDVGYNVARWDGEYYVVFDMIFTSPDAYAGHYPRVLGVNVSWCAARYERGMYHKYFFSQDMLFDLRYTTYIPVALMQESGPWQ